MEVLGGGMLAQGFARAKPDLPDCLVFARGVADSSCEDEAQFERERAALRATLEQALAKEQRLVYFSSAGKVCGPTTQPADEDAPPRPETAYGLHKVACETMVRESGADHLILRLPNVVGPGQNEKQLVPSLIRQARAGHARLHGEATRDLLHLDDVVEQTLALLRKGVRHETFHLVSGHSTPVTTIFAEIERLLGTSASVEVVPTGIRESFSNAKLTRWTGVSFPPDHYKRVLARGVAG